MSGYFWIEHVALFFGKGELQLEDRQEKRNMIFTHNGFAARHDLDGRECSRWTTESRSKATMCSGIIDGRLVK